MDDKPGEGEAPDSSGPKIIRPIPRRPFKLAFASPTPPEDDEDRPSPGPQISASDLRFLAPHQHTTSTPGSCIRDGSTPLSHTTSYLNLTSPTLFGIYSPSTIASFTRDEGDDDQDLEQSYFPDDRDLDRSDHDTIAIGTIADNVPSPHHPGLDDENYELIRERSSSLHHYPSTTTLPTTRPRPPRKQRQQVKGEVALQLALRAALLFVLGVGYGVLVTRLPQHSTLGSGSGSGSQHLRLTVAYESHYQWGYLVFWGAAGVALGSLLPWFDRFWEESVVKRKTAGRVVKMVQVVGGGGEGDGDSDGNGAVEAPVIEKSSNSAAPQADWALVVRGIGAFVGIVFAIRRLPWASTMQVSLTLALANPFLWYLIDRSKPGFLLSAAVGLAGTLVVVLTGLGVHPDVKLMPSPASSGTGPAASLSEVPSFFLLANITGTAGYPARDGGTLGGLASQETIETVIWMLSVLFCSCVCFGNIGRRLALNSSAAGRGRWGGVR
ncbi:hypothetical protein N657DRAFT_573275 [Parathielavia appendiculata]|uniref:Uncharacterized protein n=1 Tax=Parathielavia appendiculata TaxID=2587402 RepID=A0AAN6U2G6_9PEZI|nr:hypothetical protein N657DRAFT_573275 [Parathielavia appendiculata]